jgi:hypothetical protein
MIIFSLSAANGVEVGASATIWNTVSWVEDTYYRRTRERVGETHDTYNRGPFREMGKAGAGYGGPQLNMHILMHVGSRLSVTTLRATLAGRGSKHQGLRLTDCGCSYSPAAKRRKTVTGQFRSPLTPYLQRTFQDLLVLKKNQPERKSLHGASGWRNGMGNWDGGPDCQES